LANSFVTALLPLPMPPVTPITNMRDASKISRLV